MREWIPAIDFSPLLKWRRDRAMDGRIRYRHAGAAAACLALLASSCFAAEPTPSRQRVYGPVARLPPADDSGDDLPGDGHPPEPAARELVRPGPLLERRPDRDGAAVRARRRDRDQRLSACAGGSAVATPPSRGSQIRFNPELKIVVRQRARR